jgi:hypothetical protein
VRGLKANWKQRRNKHLMSNGDLLVIVPSRGRPQGVARLLDAVHATSRARTHLHVAVDEDDETLPQYQAVMDKAGGEHDVLETGPRKGLCGTTNDVAVRRAGEYPFLASLGDDMVPRTPGWDRALIRGIERMGGTGFTYPWDGVREDIPEAVVMSSDIVRALGWMCMPDLAHWYPDNVWADLGRGAGCLRHLRAIAVDHLNVAAGQAKPDGTARDNGRSLDADRDAYYGWRKERMADDIKTIVKLRERAQQPA